MKKIRFISLLLAIMMICPLFAACGNELQATVNVKFIAVDKETGEKTVLFERPGYTMVGKVEELTALNTAEKILQEYEVTYGLTADGNSIGQVKEYKNEESYDSTTGYYSYWCLYVDGERNNSGRMSTVAIYEGATLEFIFEHGSKAIEGTGVVTTDNPEDYETEKETLPETEETTEEE